MGEKLGYLQGPLRTSRKIKDRRPRTYTRWPGFDVKVDPKPWGAQVSREGNEDSEEKMGAAKRPRPRALGLRPLPQGRNVQRVLAALIGRSQEGLDVSYWH